MTEQSKRAMTSSQDDGERERLLVEQLPQVRYIARRIHERLPRHVQLEDMVHAGVVGLIDALQKFDGSKHVQFGSYAKFRIRGAILDSLREMDWSPRDLRRKARRLEEAHNTLRSSLGRSQRSGTGSRTGYYLARLAVAGGRNLWPRSGQSAGGIAARWPGAGFVRVPTR